MGTGSPGNGGTPSAAGEAAREAPSDRGKRPTPGSTGGDGAVEKPVHWTETRNLVCEACEERPNTSVAFSCYSCNLVLCTKCAVAGRHIRCAGCGTVAESRRAQWSIWAPRAAGGGASALHGTAWLVCCCCADKENSDGAGRARFAAHGDLKDLCACGTRLPPRPRVADGNLPWSPNVTRPRPRPPAGGRSGRVHAPFLHSPTTTSDIHTSGIPSIYSVL